MQAVASAAGVNKALLHYYYRKLHRLLHVSGQVYYSHYQLLSLLSVYIHWHL